MAEGLLSPSTWLLMTAQGGLQEPSKQSLGRAMLASACRLSTWKAEDSQPRPGALWVPQLLVDPMLENWCLSESVLRSICREGSALC